VVIPTFRRPAELAQAIESVLRQGDVAVEILVLDDCPDGTAEPVVLAIADPRVRYLRRDRPSAGCPALVRNAAWSMVTAPIVHFLDDDDLVPEGHYSRARAAFAAHPQIGVVFGRIEPFGDDDSEVRRERAYFENAAARARSCRRYGRRWGFAATMLFKPTLLVCGAAMIRRDCLKALDGFDISLPLMEDVDFYARAIRRFGAFFLDEVALYYRIGPSMMHREGVTSLIAGSYRLMRQRYRREWGVANFFLLNGFARLCL
jgi:glycosyltransferase involved in cell wall biosynthesis